jgi:hypothetical protein
MKHIVVLFISLFSMMFLMGGSCDSGDFTTSCDPTSTTCTSDPTQCPANGCTTGQQTFPNGQNECATLQTDLNNNSCALYNRFQQYILIGCTGVFTENNPNLIQGGPNSPGNLTAVASPGQVVLNWSAPTGLPAIPGAIVYTVARGYASLTEGAVITGLTTTTFTDNASVYGLVPGVQTFYIVYASLTYEGTFAANGPASAEVSVMSQ